MATVIQSDSLKKHHVDKYNFKVIAFGSSSSSSEEVLPQQEKRIDSSALDTKSKESLIESLMKKTDEMSSNFAKLQMNLETKEEKFNEDLQKVKEEAFAEGVKAGKAQTLEETDRDINEKLSLFINSIAKLDSSAAEFKNSLESFKSELVDAALHIAQEVIKIELDTNSSKVAKILADELVNDPQSASKVILKVNPKNHTAVSEHLGQLNNVTVLVDSAINEGGVVVISDAGNIDAQISKRFEKVKKAVLSE